MTTIKTIITNTRRHHLHPFTITIILISITVIRADEIDLENLMNIMSLDVLDFANEMERVYANRCSAQTIDECFDGSYDVCTSQFPNPECPDGNHDAIFSNSRCSDGDDGCGGLFDFTTTSVALPEHVADGDYGNPTNTEVKESICYSLQAEPYMISNFESSQSYWSTYNVPSPQKYFGSVYGAFRIHPARHYETCGSYDPTKRPWYIAASSGPKDLILILDTSGSMQKHDRLQLMKDAAGDIIRSLTLADHVAVVSFNTYAYAINNVEDAGEETMVMATKENRDALLTAVDGLEAGGGTNFLEAFQKAYDILAQSRRVERSSFCRTAILFLTDGMMTAPGGVDVADVIDLIHKREEMAMQQSSFMATSSAHVFLYGLGTEAGRGEAANALSTIACGVGGMWSHVEDGGDLSTAMSNYYKLFAFGGSDEEEGFVSWVDPYPFAYGNTMGTTVSAPVYDRSVSPRLLVGVVGMDFTMSAMDEALGVEKGSRETLDRLVTRSTAVCPTINVTECTVQSLRYDAGGNESLCPGECTDFVGIAPEACLLSSDYPSNFWKNRDYEGKSYNERVCCLVGETKFKFRANKDRPKGIIVFASAVSIAIVAFCLAIAFCE